MLLFLLLNIDFHVSTQLFMYAFVIHK